MGDHHDESWKHPWAVRLSRIVCDDTLTAAPAWHSEARGLVMDIEKTWLSLTRRRALVRDIPVQGDGDLLAATRDRALDAEHKLSALLAVAKIVALAVQVGEPCVVCGWRPHDPQCALLVAIAKAEGLTW